MTAVETLHPVQELVLDAMAAGTALRVSGRSHWIDAGRPVTATRIAWLATHAGVVDYVPGDLTITVRSGTTLHDIRNITALEGQWFPSDPFGSPDGTIGATIATGSFGPLAHGFGRTRDLVLGLEFVTGDGRTVQGGGRVVKNVAGCDLVRLIAGSWGSLGVITEVTLRLYSIHEQPVTMMLSIPETRTTLAQRLRSVIAAPLTPYAVEIVSGQLAAHIGLPARPVLLVKLGGNPASIAAQQATLGALGGVSEAPAGVWEKLRLAEDKVRSADSVASARARSAHSASGFDTTVTSPIVMRLSSLQSRVAEMWTVVAAATSGVDGALVHASPGLGIVRCVIPTGPGRDVIAKIASALPDVTTIWERLPAAMWQDLSPDVASDRLSLGIRNAFDAQGILNPGIMGPAA